MTNIRYASIHQHVYQSTHPSMRAAIHISIHLTIQARIDPLFYSSTHPCNHPSIHPSIQTLINLPIHSHIQNSKPLLFVTSQPSPIRVIHMTENLLLKGLNWKNLDVRSLRTSDVTCPVLWEAPRWQSRWYSPHSDLIYISHILKTQSARSNQA